MLSNTLVDTNYAQNEALLNYPIKTWFDLTISQSVFRMHSVPSNTADNAT